jgi:NAD(P)-dependent dehydrogenase (short-subunit alcohol dehydrogenase family)
MDEFAGRVAVVTGAASGIGRGMAEAFAAAGMKVVLADVEEGALEATTTAMREAGKDVHAVVTDVGKHGAVEALAKDAIAKYGKVHVLCNNAGVGGGGGSIWTTSLQEWQWVIDVNLWSVIYGVKAFVPHMLEHGEPAHVVNTASLAGLLTGGDNSPYSVTKFGVVALSESLYMQLQRTGGKVSASVLCPAWVNTKIMQSERNRPGGAQPPKQSNAMVRELRAWVEEQLREGLDPRSVGDTVLQAIRDDRFYILTHPDWTPMVEKRMRNILDGKNPELVMPPGSESLLARLAKLPQNG